jgi:hypothetical protein
MPLGLDTRSAPRTPHLRSNKMANTASTNNNLRKAYNPVHAACVRKYDQARAIGARKLEQKQSEGVAAPALVTLLEKQTVPKPLK